jgi:hypothetical protein
VCDTENTSSSTRFARYEADFKVRQENAKKAALAQMDAERREREVAADWRSRNVAAEREREEAAERDRQREREAAERDRQREREAAERAEAKRAWDAAEAEATRLRQQAAELAARQAAVDGPVDLTFKDCSVGMRVRVKDLSRLEAICRNPYSQWQQELGRKLQFKTGPRFNLAGQTIILTELDTDNTVKGANTWFTPEMLTAAPVSTNPGVDGKATVTLTAPSSSDNAYRDNTLNLNFSHFINNFLSFDYFFTRGSERARPKWFPSSHFNAWCFLWFWF